MQLACTAPNKVKAVTEAPHPQNQKQLQPFLGLVNYYGNFLKGFSTTAHPLNKLVEHQAKWRWTQECEDAFQELKQQLASSTVLVHYDSQKPLRLATDASPYSVCAQGHSQDFSEGISQ